LPKFQWDMFVLDFHQSLLERIQCISMLSWSLYANDYTSTINTTADTVLYQESLSPSPIPNAYIVYLQSKSLILFVESTGFEPATNSVPLPDLLSLSILKYKQLTLQ